MRIRSLAIIGIFCVIGGMTVRLPAGYALTISPTQDTDGDGIVDVQEDKNGNGIIDLGETDPMNGDTDRGGESDGSEIKAGRNPFDPTDDLTNDADVDGWANGIELLMGTDPKKADTDGDGIADSTDPFPLDPKYAKDENRNNLPDEWEIATGLIKQLATPSRSDDPDGDSLTNAEELAKGTNPLKEDTDGDGIDDSKEIMTGTDPKENSCLQLAESTQAFSDITDHWAAESIVRLQRTTVLPGALRLIKGYESNGSATFKPNQSVTRFEFLKMVILSTCTKLRTKTDDIVPSFRDVYTMAAKTERPDSLFKRQIIYTAAHMGIVKGYDDGTFRPDAPVNRAEAVKILMLASQLPSVETGDTILLPDIGASDWFAPWVLEALERQIIRGYGDGLFRPGNPITRAEAAAIIERTILQNPVINGYILLPEGSSSGGQSSGN
jgi:hypothetical protein